MGRAARAWRIGAALLVALPAIHGSARADSESASMTVRVVVKDACSAFISGDAADVRATCTFGATTGAGGIRIKSVDGGPFVLSTPSVRAAAASVTGAPGVRVRVVTVSF